jgi:tetratricopeptide (TPR) repeat protein
MSSGGLSPEISRLAAQLAKDPKSKLFIPLAEEYIKEGMADEAIMTLDDGLNHHPGYMSARVMLGKAYLQKGDVDSARSQYEAVIKAVPDNLLAHKKLGEIYVHLGMREEAHKSYNILSMLSPGDEDVRSTLKAIESGIMPKSTLVLPKTEEDNIEAAPAAETETEAPLAADAPPEMDPFAMDEDTKPAYEIPDDESGYTGGEDFVASDEFPVDEVVAEDEGFLGADMQPGPADGGLFGDDSQPSGPGFEIDMDVTAGADAQSEIQSILSEYEQTGGTSDSAPDIQSDNVYELPEEVSGPEIGGMGGFEMDEEETQPDFGGGEIFSAEPRAGGAADIFAAEPATEASDDIFGSVPAVNESPFDMADETQAGGGDIFASGPDLQETGSDEDISGSAPPVNESPFDMAAEPESGGGADIFAAEPDQEAAETGDDIFGAAPVGGTAGTYGDIFGSAPVAEEPPSDVEPYDEFDDDMEIETVDDDLQEETGGREPFSTESLAEMYVQQGFYDRAINVYKEMLTESPDNAFIKQKLEDLYVLVGMDSTVKAEEAEAAARPQAYVPVDFDSIPSETGLDEVSSARHPEPEPVALQEAYAPAGGPEAVARLERFLDNIRKRSGR